MLSQYRVPWRGSLITENWGGGFTFYPLPVLDLDEKNELRDDPELSAVKWSSRGYRKGVGEDPSRNNCIIFLKWNI